MDTTFTQSNKPFESEPIGFEDRINYPMMYHLLFTRLNDMHSEGKHSDAISHFNMMVGFFGGIFDKMFIINCLAIHEKFKDNVNKRYMLQKVEFARLMTRAGIAPKPDIRIRYKATWEAPKEFKDMSFDGKDIVKKTESLREIVKDVLSQGDTVEQV